jgi:hypothetical protein
MGQRQDGHAPDCQRLANDRGEGRISDVLVDGETSDGNDEVRGDNRPFALEPWRAEGALGRACDPITAT